MAATATELTSRWENLIGIGFETYFDTYVVPSLWLPIKELLPIEDGTEQITPKTPVGRMLPTQAYPVVFGLKKGKAKLTCVVPWCNDIATLLSKSLAKVTTAEIGTPPPYSHLLEVYDASGYALSRNAAGISLTKINGAYTEKLSGCRIVGIKFVQKQNVPLEMELEIEGSTYARGTVGALAPAITFIEGASPTKPYLMFSQLEFTDHDDVHFAAQEYEIDIKFKTTTGDGEQPLGHEARTRLDIIGAEATFKFKRVFAYEDTSGYRSKWQQSFDTGERVACKVSYSGPMVGTDTLYFEIYVGTDDWDAGMGYPGALVSSRPKVTDSGGVITEEVEIHAACYNTSGTNQFPLAILIHDSSATPATWPA